MSYKTYIVLPILILLGRQTLLYLQDPNEALNKVQDKLRNMKIADKFNQIEVSNEVTIAAVACGNLERLGELSVMIKSAVIFSNTPLKFIIFTDYLARDIEKIYTN